MIKIVYKYALIALFFITVTVSCSNHSKPSPFFDRKKMADILTDISIAEAGVNQTISVRDSFDGALKLYHDYIYKKHKTNQKEFKENYTYYVENPMLLDSVYNDVMNNLTNIRLEKSKQ